ncbi:hypothetical protein B0H67DRAFT_645778 [Lasiosphaeris hirsuta]|uniref:Cyanovirin-N domain-containing protein n=1 Tax=Lasiosphaeris hirsuta TaxID=260670 RepID=A0AA40AHU3_9PEZI|nr:hypothetical protein B0H67DRAFT_645778 [Lasiosphaeris hirsuta]
MKSVAVLITATLATILSPVIAGTLVYVKPYFGTQAGQCTFPGIYILDSPGYFKAICDHEQSYDSHIDLNHCLGNNDGQLFWREEGFAFTTGGCDSCQSREIKDGVEQSFIIDCECQNDAGNTVATSIDLRGPGNSNDFTVPGLLAIHDADTNETWLGCYENIGWNS